MTATLALLLAATTALPDDGLPEEVRRTVATYCVECHREGDVPNFETPPPASDVGAWKTVLELVAYQRMPPLEAKRSLPDDERTRLKDALTPFVYARLTPHLPPPVLDLGSWQQVAARVVADLGPEQMREIVQTVTSRESYLMMNGSHVSSAGRVGFEDASELFCRKQAAWELSQPAAKRRHLGGQWPSKGQRSAPKLAEALAAQLHRELYLETPSPEDLARGRATFQAFEKLTQSWSETWVALCTCYLSAPRTLHREWISNR
jgi:hypothetical protein